MTSPTRRESEPWKKLVDLAEAGSGRDLRELFAADPDRAARLNVTGAGVTLDFSKQLVTDEILLTLFDLAHDCQLEARRDAMFSGEHVNVTEDRPALHTGLRLAADASLHVDGQDVVADVHKVLARMGEFANQVRNGQWRGHTGSAIRNIVNIGIGGSDLGPQMAALALAHYSRRDMLFRFVSNVDGTDLTEAVRDLRAEETLFVISSKTFGTAETLANAKSARDWLRGQLGEDVQIAQHFVAVSTAADRVRDFGIDVNNMFEFWDWVGGRYSMDSAIGLSTMLAIGPEGFAEMLAGFRDMDEHFASTPIDKNLPVIHGLIAVWNRTFLGSPTVVVAPYDHYLRRLPAYLAQLTMESNGKHVSDDGVRLDEDTGAIYWGEPGTNAQHSFFQLLHQGTTVVPVDFIAVLRSLNPIGQHHDLLTANVLAQSRALAFGRTMDELAAAGVPESQRAAREMPGNRPSHIIALDLLTPRSLGTLIAFYEHSVFTQGVIWGIDSFDQWGVELGKVIAADILSVIEGQPGSFDSSTDMWIDRYRQGRGSSV